MKRQRLLLVLGCAPFLIALLYLGVALSLDRKRPADPARQSFFSPQTDVEETVEQPTAGEVLAFYWPEFLCGALAIASVVVYVVTARLTRQPRPPDQGEEAGKEAADAAADPAAADPAAADSAAAPQEEPTVQKASPAAVPDDGDDGEEETDLSASGPGHSRPR